MSFIFTNDTPIYLQIVKHVKSLIVSGVYAPLTKLPSVRDFSIEYNVNPNTALKALQELERLNLIYTDRTNGKFVTGDESVLKQVKSDAIRQLSSDFLKEATRLGFTKQEVINIINKEN